SKRGPIKPKPGPFSTERAVHGFPGVSTLRALLEPIVQSGRAGMESVDRDVTSVLGQLTALIGGPAAQPAAAPLVEALVARRIDAGISEYATEAGKPLPEAWRSAIKNAATLRRDELEGALDKAAEAAEANRPKRVWVPGGRRRADARAENQLRLEVEKLAMRYVMEPV